MKPKGKALLLFLTSNPLYQVFAELAKLERYGKYKDDINTFISVYHKVSEPLKLFTSYVNSVGLKLCQAEVRNKVYVYSGRDELRREFAYLFQDSVLQFCFIDSIESFNPIDFKAKITGEKREIFFMDIYEIIQRITENKIIDFDTPIVWRYSVMVAALEK